MHGKNVAPNYNSWHGCLKTRTNDTVAVGASVSNWSVSRYMQPISITILLEHLVTLAKVFPAGPTTNMCSCHSHSEMMHSLGI